MILLAQNVVVLHANVSRVFKFTTNMENYKKWFPGVLDIRSANKLAHGQIGKQYIEILQFPQGNKELTIEVKESIENMKFVTEGDLEPLLPKMEVLFSAWENNGCQLHLSYVSRNPDLKEDDEFILAIKEDLSKRIKTAANNLKAIVEE